MHIRGELGTGLAGLTGEGGGRSPILLGDAVSQPPALPPTPPLSHLHLTSGLEMRADVMSERPRGRIKGSEEKAEYGLHLKRLNQGWGDKEGSGRELGVPDTLVRSLQSALT